ncbi:MAG: hypothetical protein M1299_07860 [Firmicutes bacterium]|nr:hypothetical protein [Bacillota bacterium]MCL5039716.1 hypothetical protein [Bacillota bacterium]
MRKSILLGGVLLLFVLGIVLSGCSQSQPPVAQSTPTPSSAAADQEVLKRIEAIEKKVGNVEGTPFNGKDISILGTTPMFALTMREYGDRYSDMFFAAKGGNWALAAYLDHYLRKALTWTKVTKPLAQDSINSFNKTYLDPLLVTVGKKDFKAFEEQYNKTLQGCNACHKAMGYGFVEILPPKEPADKHMDYSKKTEPKDYKDFKLPGS